MADKAWKAFERRVAAFFGCLRNPLSGSNSRHSESDTLHETLYIECKQKARIANITLWDDTKIGATKEGKIPVVALSVKGRRGFWILCHSEDLTAIANQRLRVRL